MQSNVPHPLFAPATQKGQDDIDFNEVFAEYFINEFDDPINAYTSSMANYSSVTVPMAETGVPSIVASTVPVLNVAANTGVLHPGQASLPTGGIRTVFHSGAATAGLPGHAPPASKKPRVDPGMVALPVAVAPQPFVGQHLGIPLHVMPQPNVMPQPLSHPGGLGAQQVPQQLAHLPKPPPGHQVGAQIALPVGVGIRLGGIGGIAPATAQDAARAPGVQAQYSMWGPNVDGGASEQVVAERRQRNREHAKRSRVRKKFMLESLQGQVRQLQKENQRLRMIVQEHIPDDAMKIITECCTKNPLFDDPDDLTPKPITEKSEALERQDFSLVRSLATGQKCFVLSDPKLPDNPIIFASEGFYKLTGYTSKEVLGRNCRFLQGPGTDKQAVDVIRKAVSSGSDATVCLLNYKADGTPFWNQFFLAALRDSDNCIVNYVGVQTEVDPDTGTSALEDKVNAVMPLQTKDEKSA